MGRRARNILLRVGPLIAVVLFALALIVLRRELAGHRYAEIVAQLRGIHPATVVAGLGFTFLGYGVLTRYDALALRYVHRRFRWSRVAFASFIAYSLSQTVGFAIFTGGAVRYRFWSSWGLSTAEIARAVGFAGLTLWLGIVTLAGVAMLVDPEVLGGLTRLTPLALQIAGAVLLLAPAGYLILSAARSMPVRVFGWALEIPRFNLAFEQLLVACLDWVLAAGVLWVLLPVSPGITFPALVGLFVLAQVAGLISHLPGGLGVFDTLIVLALRPYLGAGQVVGALLAFRALYYLIPFLLGALLLLGAELVRQRTHLLRVARWAGRWVPGVIPYALSLLTLAGGIVLLASGSTPGIPSRLTWLGGVLPLPVIEVSHFIGSVTGMALVILAWGLHRRLDAAYYLTVVLLVVGAVASVLKGADYEEAILLLLILAALLPSRRRFFRRAKLLSEPFTVEWLVTVLLVLVAVLAIGEFRYRHVSYSNELWWRFALDADAPRFLRAMVGALALLTGFGLLRLLHPSRPTPTLPGKDDLDRAELVVQQSGTTQANLALCGDKALLWSESGRGFIAYGVSGRSWVAMGDPVAPAEERSELAWAFRALAHRHAGWSVFYEVGREHLPLYLDLGLTLTKLGEAGRVDLPEFSLEGSRRSGLRRFLRQAERDGAVFEILPREAIPGLIPALQQISDDWLASKGTREKGFSMGGFDPAYLTRFRHAIVRRGGTIVAFANLWETGTKIEASIDLMRYGQAAPDHVMDFLIANALLWAKGEGYRWFNLGMAPLSGLERRNLAPLWHRLGALLYGHGERFYHFQGLRHFKERFDPVWEPQYLASPGGLALPRILTNVSTLISEGWRGVLGR